jgi:hypothetical protein
LGRVRDLRDINIYTAWETRRWSCLEYLEYLMACVISRGSACLLTGMFCVSVSGWECCVFSGQTQNPVRSALPRCSAFAEIDQPVMSDKLGHWRILKRRPFERGKHTHRHGLHLSRISLYSGSFKPIESSIKSYQQPRDVSSSPMLRRNQIN